MNFPNFSEVEVGLFWAKTFARGITDAVLIVDAGNNLMWFNDAAKHFLRLKSDDHGSHISNVFNVPALSDYLSEGKVSSVELPLPKHPDQMVSVILIPYGEHVILIAQDISYRHHVDRMRQDFVANVSHEMRTPLTVIQGYLEMMELEVVDQLPHWAPYIDQMNHQMSRLETLLEELLLLSRLQSHKLKDEELEEVDVPVMLARLIADMERLSNGRHVFRLEIEEGLKLKGNYKELMSCFANLLTNAVRYSPDGGEIEVGWYKDKTGRHFYVQDQGIGIADKHIPRITERFYRVDKGRSRQTGGTGLGLSIVKHVLLRHKASLFIQSEPGKGSLFRCDFG
ncbi:MAG: phosphate regulon sensor histidine kinase PhoR [Francisellaceae bacterium]